MSPPERSASAQPGGAPDPDLHSDARWKLVERILGTGPFQKSTNLHGLLSYLAEQVISGRTDALTERQIGIAVFGKPVDYSPAEDSAVRVHVRQLRLRLHEYFAQEGRLEPLRIDIPKGSYVLEFVKAWQPAGPQPESTEPDRSQARPPRRNVMREVAFWVVFAVAIVFGIGWYRSAHAKTQSHVPWPLNGVVQQDRQTTIVVSDGNLSVSRLLDPKEISLDDYLQPDFRESLFPLRHDESFDRMLAYLSHSELTSFADIAVVSVLERLAGPDSDQVSLTSARDLDRRDLEKGNYIFVGSAISNPWVSLFADKLNFKMVEEGVGGRMYFRNRSPRPGEQQEYEGLVRTGSPGDDFATISLLPSSLGQGNVLILQGLRQEGTESLGALLSNASDRVRLEQAVRRGTNGPPYFEALIRSRAIAGAPVSIEIVATRDIQP
jgi:hypothetical protein